MEWSGLIDGDIGDRAGVVQCGPVADVEQR